MLKNAFSPRSELVPISSPLLGFDSFISLSDRLSANLSDGSESQPPLPLQTSANFVHSTVRRVSELLL